MWKGEGNSNAHNLDQSFHDFFCRHKDLVLKEDGIYAGMWKQQLESNKESLVDEDGAVIKELEQDGSEILNNQLDTKDK